MRIHLRLDVEVSSNRAVVFENIATNELVNFVFLLFRGTSTVMENLLSATLFTARPELATQYADATTLLFALTGIWLIFEFITAAKKIVRGILVVGWVLLIVSVVITQT